MTDIVRDAADARQRFLALVADVLPELHRYCTRMTGSIFDGEDVVQDTLAKAWYALAELAEPPPLRPWLFRIAHNTAIDALRRYEHKHVDVMAEPPEIPTAEQPPDAERVEAALEIFATLPVVQRSALALKDVLGHSLEETATTMGITVAAVKAALVRARARVATATPTTTTGRVDVTQLRRYADLFNARDWDGLRALFTDETQLGLVARYQRRGRAAAEYFTQYAARAPQEELRAVPGTVDGTPVLAIFRAAAPDPAYFLRLHWNAEGDARLAHVRDFRYVPYLVTDARFRAS